jgi:hypothetical protein
MSIRDYDEEKKDVTIKHYRIRKMDSGGCYISPKKTFNNMLELIEHYKGGFRLSASSVSWFDYVWLNRGRDAKLCCTGSIGVVLVQLMLTACAANYPRRVPRSPSLYLSCR